MQFAFFIQCEKIDRLFLLGGAERFEIVFCREAGSNILDTLLPIGIAAVLSHVAFERQLLFFDLPFIFVMTTVVLAFFYTKRGVAKREGVVILGFYSTYVIIKLLQF